MGTFKSAEEFLRLHSPVRPVLGLRPHAARRAARWFQHHFPGKTLYAVKANPMPIIIDALYKEGIRDFDVTSMPEVEQMAAFPQVTLYFMNPVKSRATIAKAYYEYGVRIFALDCRAELEKISEATGAARDLTLFVRIACEGRGSRIPLARKFGADPDEVVDLLLAARSSAEWLGVSFHVGSQAMEPCRYREAMHHIDALIVESGVLPDIIDVGGGFPSAYTNLSPPPLGHYVSEIKGCFDSMNVFETCELICEPGRALVAEASSVIARVELRRGGALYLNDGAFGSLFDAAHFGFVYPVVLLPQAPRSTGALKPFLFYGPTCDSFDLMPGPFYLPGCVREGDFIEIGQLGAYGHVLGTRFNGHGLYDEVILRDEPMMTMYGGLDGREDVECVAGSESC